MTIVDAETICYTLLTEKLRPRHVMAIMPKEGGIKRKEMINVLLAMCTNTRWNSYQLGRLDIALRRMVNEGRLEKIANGTYQRRRR